MQRLIKAEAWNQVEQIATQAQKCIRPDGGNNWQRAKQTWEVYHVTDDVIYYIAHPPSQTKPEGYIRLLRVAGFGASVKNTTYIADFVEPSCYLFPILAAHMIDGALFCKAFNTADAIWARSWPTIRLAFPHLDRYPYHNQMSAEADWLLVPRGK